MMEERGHWIYTKWKFYLNGTSISLYPSLLCLRFRRKDIIKTLRDLKHLRGFQGSCAQLLRQLSGAPVNVSKLQILRSLSYRNRWYSFYDEDTEVLVTWRVDFSTFQEVNPFLFVNGNRSVHNGPIVIYSRNHIFWPAARTGSGSPRQWLWEDDGDSHSHWCWWLVPA